MYEDLIKIAATQGVWSVLSCILILYILKNQEKRDIKQEEREKKYQTLIEKLTNELEVINSINVKIDNISKKY